MRRRISDSKVRKILMIKRGGLGDVIMTTPAFTALRDFYPKANITLLTTPIAKPLFECDPRIDEVIDFHWPIKGDEKAHQSEVNELGMSLRDQKFDLVVDLRGDEVTSRITKLTGAPFRLGFHSLGCGFFHGFRYNIRAKSPDRSVHRVELARAILEPLWIPVFERLDVRVSPEDRAWARDFLTESSALDRPKLVIHPSAADRSKCWHVECFRDVAMQAAEKGIKPIIVGTADEDETDMLLRSGKGQLISAVGATTTRQLAALIQSCNVFLGNDSGPMHLACAVGTPTVAIFKSTDPSRFRPVGDQHVVFAGNISPDAVWGEIATRLVMPQRAN